MRFIRPGEQFIQVAPFWLDATQAPAEPSQAVTLEPCETMEGVNLQVKAGSD